MIQELDCVRLDVDVPERGLRRGDVGAVVFVAREGASYEVEFLAPDGRTRAVVTLDEGQIRPLSAPVEIVGAVRPDQGDR